MFRRYEVEVKFKENNTLTVKFNSSANYDLGQEALFKEKYGFTLPQNYSFTRKASYQYGWDWGPRILTVGIWKNVNILLYNDSRIDNLRITHQEIDKKTTRIVGSVSA
jgi:beta-mannosidase